MRFFAGLCKAILYIVLIAVVLAGALVGYLTITEYTPASTEPIPVDSVVGETVQSGQSLTLLSFNIGYAAMDADMDFFMDGGKGVHASSRVKLYDNLDGITALLQANPADILLLQEVDADARRSYYVDERRYLQATTGQRGVYTQNYLCDFVPYPWPMLGKVDSGLCTLTNLRITSAERVSLPVPFTWPLRICNLKRCLLVNRMPVEGSGKELVVVNLHLEAYDNGEGKQAQTKQLQELLAKEYSKGNYVVAGGDFNQTFPNLDAYALQSDAEWQPGTMAESNLPTGFAFAVDADQPTCRLLNKPYTGNQDTTQFYAIDGFIVSPNIEVERVQVVDGGFQFSDHQPVCLEFHLLETESD